MAEYGTLVGPAWRRKGRPACVSAMAVPSLSCYSGRLRPVDFLKDFHLPYRPKSPNPRRAVIGVKG